jgi:hypothetical protein
VSSSGGGDRARIITRELARKILKKLKSKKTGKKGAAHTEYAIEHEGQIVALTTLRHGSEKDLGHHHMPGDLHVGPNFAKGLGQCPRSRNDYIRNLQEQGLIEGPEGEAEEAEEADEG